jgi:hypothetical protein
MASIYKILLVYVTNLGRYFALSVLIRLVSSPVLLLEQIISLLLLFKITSIYQCLSCIDPTHVLHNPGKELM